MARPNCHNLARVSFQNLLTPFGVSNGVVSAHFQEERSRYIKLVQLHDVGTFRCRDNTLAFPCCDCPEQQCFEGRTSSAVCGLLNGNIGIQEAYANDNTTSLCAILDGYDIPSSGNAIEIGPGTCESAI